MKISGSDLKKQVFGKIPDDLFTAKNTLRDRLFSVVEKSMPQALALRKAKRFQAAIGSNLVGLGIGEKVTSGNLVGELCIKILVAKKFPKGKVSFKDRIPALINEIPTDVEEVGYPRKFLIPQQRRRHRPVPGGVSVGLDFNSVDYSFAGTLGVIAVDRQDSDKFYALSNNHVLADENRVNTGAGVVQPGTLDDGKNSDQVALLARYVPLKFDNHRNWMDAAIAEFNDHVKISKNILGIGVPLGAARPSLNLLVRKSGRTTGLTEGIIRVLNFDIYNIQYDQGFVRVDDVVVIKGVDGHFSKAGDSGSAIVDSRGRVVALLFAGSEAVTYAIPIHRILRRLRIKIAT